MPANTRTKRSLSAANTQFVRIMLHQYATAHSGGSDQKSLTQSTNLASQWLRREPPYNTPSLASTTALFATPCACPWKAIQGVALEWAFELQNPSALDPHSDMRWNRHSSKH
eukprot:2470893-Amphidinium_carterae.1